jgi:hypothetical protein
MNSIRILGGGISGLTAAINLKKAGIAVEVHERKGHCGKNTNDFQFLENWIFHEDALEILQGLNIQTNFYAKPWHSMEFMSYSLKRCVKRSSQPLMYLVKRGPGEDTIDHALQKQAMDSNIPIIFRSRLTADEADIIATGARKPNYIAMGITFTFDHPDKSILILDDRLSFKAYSYFIVNDKIGEIVSGNPVGRDDHEARFNLAVQKFEDILDFTIGAVIHRFAAPASLFFLESAKINGRYYIGEAAGFQDCLNGFGMMYAFKSGYHASRSIIENDDFDKRWKMDMLKPMKVSRANRRVFEQLSNDGYEKIIGMLDSRNPAVMKLLGGDDLRFILRRLYNQPFSYLLRAIILWRNLERLYRFLLKWVNRMFFR